MSCPSCGATVRAGDPWCTLCWTDLRPPPPVPAAAPVDPVTAPVETFVPRGKHAAPPDPAPVTAAAPLAAPVAASHWAGQPAASAVAVDPLTAPLAVVLGQPLAADAEAPSVPTWPCVECGGRSPLDAMACTTCGTPFGGRISRLDDARAVRQRRMMIGVAAAVGFLALLAALTFATTPAPPAPETSSEVVLPE